MPRNNGFQVVALQVEERDALILDITAAQQRKSRSELLAPIIQDFVSEQIERFEDNDIEISTSEFQSEMEMWAAELEKTGQLNPDKVGELNLRVLVNAKNRRIKD